MFAEFALSSCSAVSRVWFVLNWADAERKELKLNVHKLFKEELSN